MQWSKARKCKRGLAKKWISRGLSGISLPWGISRILNVLYFQSHSQLSEYEHEHCDRMESAKDVNRLEILFAGLHFQVKIYKNLRELKNFER